jgi:hypothetical protein
MDGWMDGWMDRWIDGWYGNQTPVNTAKWKRTSVVRARACTPAHARIYLFTRSRRGKFINWPIVDGAATRSHARFLFNRNGNVQGRTPGL